MNILTHFDVPDCVGVADMGDGSYMVDTADGGRRVATAEEVLGAAKLATRAQINAERNRREQGGFVYAGKTIDSDPVSCQRISVAGATAQLAIANSVPDYLVPWTCSDNSTLSLDAVGVLGLVQALGVHGLHVHAAAKAHKYAVDALGTVEAVLAYDYSIGWPE